MIGERSAQATKEMPLGDIVRLQAQRRAGAAALICGNEALTYATLERRANQIANGLHAAGIHAGDRVAYLGLNGLPYFEILFGAAKIGAIFVPLNWRLAAPEVAAVLADAGVKRVFAARTMAAQLANPVIPIEWVDESGYCAWRDGQPSSDPNVSVDPADCAVLVYTSGTTGRPKGVMLSHASLLTLRLQVAVEAEPEWNRWSHDDVSLIVMPLFHVGGLCLALWTLLYGASGVVVPSFDIDRILEELTRHSVSKLFLVPTALRLLIEHPRVDQADLSRIRYIMYGAAPIPLELVRKCMDKLRCGFIQMYGMTETAGTVTVLTPLDHEGEETPRMRSVGRALPGVTLAIAAADGRNLAPGEIGEVLIRSPSMMTGYWGMPEATAEVLSGGWLRSGDAGYVDGEGYLYLCDRVKDMIISGGENIYPAEVENALYGHPDVAEVAVIGLPSDRWGESVHAVIVPRSGIEPDRESIIAWTRTRIAGYKVPRSIEFVDQLPRNPSGKVLRRLLREARHPARSHGS
jgi:acyl-CoA synthetase (AMP-forming)/AMP-acid ligase II